MLKYTYECDGCPNTAVVMIQTLPENWVSISATARTAKGSTSLSSKYVCPECSARAKIEVEKAPLLKTEAEKLYDLVYNVAVNAVEDNGGG